jgi:hypothetical protein
MSLLFTIPLLILFALVIALVAAHTRYCSEKNISFAYYPSWRQKLKKVFLLLLLLLSSVLYYHY